MGGESCNLMINSKLDQLVTLYVNLADTKRKGTHHSENLNIISELINIELKKLKEQANGS